VTQIENQVLDIALPEWEATLTGASRHTFLVGGRRLSYRKPQREVVDKYRQIDDSRLDRVGSGLAVADDRAYWYKASSYDTLSSKRKIQKLVFVLEEGSSAGPCRYHYSCDIICFSGIVSS